MVSSPLTPFFTPDPTQVAAILTDLTSTEHSLADVAELHHTTIDALSAWAARPEIQDRLRAIETLAAQRARLAAAAHLPLAIGALADMLTAYRADESRTPMRGDLKSIHLAEIRRSNARRAANLIMRLARFSSFSPLLPGDGKGEGVRAPRASSTGESTHITVQHPPSLREGAGGRVPPSPPAPVPFDLSALSDQSSSTPAADSHPSNLSFERSSFELCLPRTTHHSPLITSPAPSG